MELIVTNNNRGWDHRDGLEFKCSLCDYGSLITFYNDNAVKHLKELIYEHLTSCHSTDQIIDFVIIKSLFERIGIYGNKAIEVEKSHPSRVVVVRGVSKLD